MSDVRAAQRYASAIFNVAEEHKSTDVVSKDFETLSNAIRSSHEFFLFIKSPIISTERKKNIFLTLFRGNISDLSLRFIILLAQKNREGLISEIIEQFFRLKDRARGILNVYVSAAIKLSPEQEKHFTKNIADATGKSVRMTFSVDPMLRGGFTIQYDDTVVDASVQRQLDRLKTRLSERIS